MAIVDDLLEQKFVREIVFETDFELVARAIDDVQRHDVLHSQRKLGIHLAVNLNTFKERIGKVIHGTDDEKYEHISSTDK